MLTRNTTFVGTLEGDRKKPRFLRQHQMMIARNDGHRTVRTPDLREASSSQDTKEELFPVSEERRYFLGYRKWKITFSRIHSFCAEVIKMVVVLAAGANNN